MKNGNVFGIVMNFDVLINCAAIVGQGKCERAGYDAVMEANVYLPKSICEAVWQPREICGAFFNGRCLS